MPAFSDSVPESQRERVRLNLCVFSSLLEPIECLASARNAACMLSSLGLWICALANDICMQNAYGTLANGIVSKRLNQLQYG